MPAPLEFRLVDAFTLAAFGGNVAGVILDAAGLSDRQMQLIAAELNAGATAFILPPTTTKAAAVRLRWFSPGCELRMCGHATLAAVHALRESGRFVRELAEPGMVLPLETLAGILTLRVEQGRQPAGAAPLPDTLWLDMPDPRPKSRSVPVPAIAHRLGLPQDAIDPALPAIRTRDDDVILAVKTLASLLELSPPMGDLARYCRAEGIRGVFVTTTNVLSAATAVQSRFFAPAVGIDEDAVSGSVHGPLGLLLVESGIIPLVNGKADFTCAQARGGGRAGLVRVVVTQSAAGEVDVRIGGSCVTTASGVFTTLPLGD